MLNVAKIWTPEHQQHTFRSILEAMSRPGMVQAIASDQQSDTLGAVLATLLDGTVSLADPESLIEAAAWPMMQANQADSEQADFIVCEGKSSVSMTPKLGTLEGPEQSATLILKVQSLTQGDMTLSFSGPGVNGTKTVQLSGLNPDWLTHREDWVCEFPLGVDLLLVDEQGLMAIPRTTKVEVK